MDSSNEFLPCSKKFWGGAFENGSSLSSVHQHGRVGVRSIGYFIETGIVKVAPGAEFHPSPVKAHARVPNELRARPFQVFMYDRSPAVG